jgi:hypothetical protein
LREKRDIGDLLDVSSTALTETRYKEFREEKPPIRIRNTRVSLIE